MVQVKWSVITQNGQDLGDPFCFLKTGVLASSYAGEWSPRILARTGQP